MSNELTRPVQLALSTQHSALARGPLLTEYAQHSVNETYLTVPGSERFPGSHWTSSSLEILHSASM